MSDDQHHEVTIGEVYRALIAQNKVLDEIRKETRATNGQVLLHGARLDALDRDLHDLKHPSGPRRPPDDPTGADDRAITVRIPLNTKTVMVVVTAAAALILLVIRGGGLHL